MIVAKESSVQLVLQNAILLYNLYYDSYSKPTTGWEFNIFLHVTSIIMSTFCTFLPILDDFNLTCYKQYLTGATTLQFIIHLGKIFIHVIISIGLVFLGRFFQLCFLYLFLRSGPIKMYWPHMFLSFFDCQ